MTDKHLYFARLDHLGFCVAGGHFLATDAAHAKREATKAFEATRLTGISIGLPPVPSVSDCVLSVRRSKSDVSQACNISA